MLLCDVHDTVCLYVMRLDIPLKTLTCSKTKNMTHLPFDTGVGRVICGFTGDIPNALLLSCTAMAARGVVPLLPGVHESK